VEFAGGAFLEPCFGPVQRLAGVGRTSQAMEDQGQHQVIGRARLGIRDPFAGAKNDSRSAASTLARIFASRESKFWFMVGP
jgi:hypothetical protein